jgi:hypothetical protein
MLLISELRHVAAFAVKFQPVLASQSGYELLIGVRFCSTQLVVEMNNGENDTKVMTQCKQQAQERD